jgi:hypothetical protein
MVCVCVRMLKNEYGEVPRSFFWGGSELPIE